MAPFGKLYGLRGYVDEALTRYQEVAFEAGSLRELIRMAYTQVENLFRPKS